MFGVLVLVGRGVVGVRVSVLGRGIKRLGFVFWVYLCCGLFCLLETVEVVSVCLVGGCFYEDVVCFVLVSFYA